MTQTEARAKLKALTADLSAPKPTRPGYDKPDGREVIKRWTHWQDQANRILGRKRA